MNNVDWRGQLPLDARQRIVNKISETLKKHLRYSGQEGLQELENIAVRCEEDVYSAATSQSDYLRKISLKMLSVEGNSPQTGAANASGNSSDLGSRGQYQQNSSTVSFMDGNTWRGSQAPMVQRQAGTAQQSVISSSASSASPMALNDWRAQLPLDARQRITVKILETLMNHLPYSGQVGLQELENIAVRFEENVYSSATSQSDYLRRISLKMLTLVTQSQRAMANPLQTGAVNASRNYSDLGSRGQYRQNSSTVGFMDGNTWRGSQAPMVQPQAGTAQQSVISSSASSASPMVLNDWRAQLTLDSRQRLTNKILETLTTHLPYSGPEGLEELWKVAVRFEAKMYSKATSQAEYLRMISLKMLTMARSQSPMATFD